VTSKTQIATFDPSPRVPRFPRLGELRNKDLGPRCFLDMPSMPAPCAGAGGIEQGAVALAPAQLAPGAASGRGALGPRIVQLARSRALHPCCAACLAPVGSSAVQILLAAGHDDRAHVLEEERAGRTPALLPAPFAGANQEASSSPRRLYPCAHGCGELYCSDACRECAWLHGHRLLCVGRCKDETHPLYQFKVLALTHSESFSLGAQILAQIICACAFPGCSSAAPSAANDPPAQLATAIERLTTWKSAAEGAGSRAWWDVADYEDALHEYASSLAQASSAGMDASDDDRWRRPEEKGEVEEEDGEGEDEEPNLPAHLGDAMRDMNAQKRKKLAKRAHHLLVSFERTASAFARRLCRIRARGRVGSSLLASAMPNSNATDPCVCVYVCAER
jgi:hypothetical protein